MQLRYLSLLLLLMAIPTVSAALTQPTVVEANKNSTNGSGVTSLNMSITLTGNSSRVLVVGIQWRNATGAGTTIGNVAINGILMNQENTQTTGTSPNSRVAMYTLDDVYLPAAGTYTIQANISSAQTEMGMFGVEIYNARQNRSGSTAGAVATAGSTTVGSSVSNVYQPGVAFEVCGTGDTRTVTGFGAGEGNIGTAANGGMSYKNVSSLGTTTLTCTFNASATQRAITLISLGGIGTVDFSTTAGTPFTYAADTINPKISELYFVNGSGSVTSKAATDTQGRRTVSQHQVCVKPNSYEAMLVEHTASGGSDTYQVVQVFNGTSIIANKTLTNTTPALATRLFSCAYESQSKEALFVTTTSTANNGNYYFTWNGSAFGNQILVGNDGNTGSAEGVPFLFCSPSSDQCILTAQVGTTSTYGWVWNGTNFTNPKNFTTTAARGNAVQKGIDCIWETSSRNAVCFYYNAAGKIGAIEWNGSTWGTETNYTTTYLQKTTNADIFFKATQNGDNAIGIASNAANLTGLHWNGTNIDYENNLSSTTQTSVTAMHIALEIKYNPNNDTTEEGIAMWGNDSTTNPMSTIMRSTWNGSVWSAQASNSQPANGVSVSNIMMDSDINAGYGDKNYWMMYTSVDTGSAGKVSMWNGTANTTHTADGSLQFNTQPNNAPSFWRIDNRTPVYSTFSQNNDTVYNGSTVQAMNATIRDQYRIDCAWLHTNETGTWTNWSTTNGRNTCALYKYWGWQNVSLNWTNTSLASTTVGWQVCFNDTQGNNNCTATNTFTFVAAGGGGGGGNNSCQNFMGRSTNTILCSDACTINTNTDAGYNNVVFTGTGTINVNARITNTQYVEVRSSTGCLVNVNSAIGGWLE